MKSLLKIGLISFISVFNAQAAGTAIFNIKATLPFPGTGTTTPVVVNAGENLSGTYNVTLSSRWPSRVRVFPTLLPSGMSVDKTIGCGKNPILSPGNSCQLTLHYKVPSVSKRTLINVGPDVCTSDKRIHCSQPTALNRFNMAIDNKPVPIRLLEGLQSLLLGNNTSNLNDWFKINQAETYYSIAYGSGRWVIAGGLTSDNKTNIQISSDGVVWNRVSLSTSDVLLGAYYSTSNKQWLLNGVNGVLYHSTNGINFTRIKLPTGQQITSVLYSPPNGSVPGYWVAMGGDTTNYTYGVLFTSTDGINWQLRASVASPFTFVSLATNPQGETVVLSRQENWWLGAKVATSVNGSLWTVTDFTYPPNEQYKFNSIVWSSLSNKWVVVGAHWFFNGSWSFGGLGLETTTPAIPASYTQIPALSDNSLNPNVEDQSIVTNNSRLVVVASDGIIFYSSNGVNWTKYQIGPGFVLDNPTFGLVDGVSSLVLTNESSELYKAPLSNLSSWEKIPDFPDQRLERSLLFSSGSPAWFSVGTDNTIYSSANGENWSIISQRDRSNTIPNIGLVLRADPLNQWLILAQDVTRFSGISYSSDGIIWAKAILPNSVLTNDNLWSAAYSLLQKKYLLVGTSALTNNTILLSSTNGTTWTEQVSNLNQEYLRSIYWNQSLSQWLAVGSTIISSADGGVTWNQAQGVNLNTSSLRGIGWSTDLNQYLVVGQDFSNGQEVLYRSNDGINWVQQLLPEQGYLRDAAYSPTKKLWVIVGFTGTILTSTDGSTWNRINWLPTQTDWDLWSVKWDPSLKLWIASGGSSISQYGGNILIYSSDGQNWTISTNKQPYLTSSLAIKQ